MRYISFLVLLALISCQSKPKQEVIKIPNTPPEWAKSVIWYQIFVERFNNGDPTNDPTPKTIYDKSNFIETPSDWSVTPWTTDWFAKEDWAQETNQNFYSNLQLRRYGGDLQGVLNKLDYLQDLGITALYFNPLNDAPSLHKYDARNYHHIDVTFGPDPEGDMAIIASEDPGDPSTWKWTAADKMFLKVVDEAHKRGMRVVLDYSWNHTGVEFWAWKDLLKNQEQSKYKDWYAVESFDDPNTEEDEFSYSGWLGLNSLPELKKVNTHGTHKAGIPFEGDLNPGAKQHVFDVSERWLAPNGDVSKGIDGYRLDVADHVPLGFWRDYRTHVKSINPEAYLVGEIWWKVWPDEFMDPVPYTSGDIFDAVMFYHVYRPARYFFADTDYEIDAANLVDSLNLQWNRLEEPFRYGMMNVNATHDTPRLLSSFNNRDKYKYKANLNDDPNYKAGKPEAETYERVKLYLMHQFTNIGAPQIWNGDEMGMWGADDPDCRKPLWWPEFTFDPENQNNIKEGKPKYTNVGFNAEWHNYYKQLCALRNGNSALIDGDINFIKAEDKLLAYTRSNASQTILTVLNAGTSSEVFQLPKGTYTDALTQEIISASTIELGGLKGRVLILN